MYSLIHPIRIIRICPRSSPFMYCHWKWHSHSLQVQVESDKYLSEGLTELLAVLRKEKPEPLQQLRQEKEEKEAEEIVFPKQRHRRNCNFYSLLCFFLPPPPLHIQVLPLMGFQVHPCSF